MNKNAIKKFAIEARKKLIDSVADKAGMLGITEKSCSEPITKGVDFEVYQTVAGTEVTLNKRQCEQRRRLVSQINSRGFETVVEEVAYTWFNRICAIRFMEVNDYLPNRVRVLSSEKEGKMEPDLVTLAPDVDLDLTEQEKEEIINWKLSGTTEDTDKLYCKLFLKQCHQMHDILPGLFEADSDYMELLFGISYTNKDDVIYMLVNPDTGIPENDFNVSAVDEEGNPTGQVEIIGWLYQYYNTELKDDTFAKLKKNIKITKERIPAATQLFTPDWIVRYMVENSVGRIWLDHLRAVDPSTDEKAMAEIFGWKYYLPEAEQEEPVNVKLAEIRSNYKELKPTDITCIDPCMGSGHILIAMFDVLMDIYESAGYDKREAAFEIVEHNIHGLDIDQRAYQMAYFSVMMKGREYNRRFLRGRDGKPEPKVYAIVESNGINRDHLKFFGDSLAVNERMQAVEQMKILLDTFVDAREYGSIINVDEYNWGVLNKFVDDLDNNGQISFERVGSEETQEQLRAVVKVAQNLGKKFCAVITNPPYMGDLNKTLQEYVKKYYPNSKHDLCTVFIERCLSMVTNNNYVSMITQNAFMFLSRYEKLRNSLLQYEFVNMAHLGAKAFDTIGGEVVQTTAFCLRKTFARNYVGTYERLVDYPSEVDKEEGYLKHQNTYYCQNETFDVIPKAPMTYWVSEKILSMFKAKRLDEYAIPKVGMFTTDNERYLREWWEPQITDIGFNYKDKETAYQSDTKWFPYNKGGGFRRWYGNIDLVVFWQHGGEEIKRVVLKKYPYLKGNYDFVLKTDNPYYQPGITWSGLTSGANSFRICGNGFLFDTNKGAMIFKKDIDLLYLLGYLNTKVAQAAINLLNSTISLQIGDVAAIPVEIDNEKYEVVKNLSQDCVDICKKDWDSYETAWDFTRHPLLAVISKNANLFDDIENIDIAECYMCWENECNERFYRLKSNEEELNRIFIGIYGLQDEMTPEVEEKDITVRKANMRREVKSFISYAVGCMFGRYSVNKEGLVYAGGNIDDIYWKCQGLAPLDKDGIPVSGYAGISLAQQNYGYFRDNSDWEKATRLSFTVDYDNIIPIVDEEYFTNDIVGRFVEFVSTVYGYKSLETNLDFIANALGNKGNTSREVIRNYFLKDFYADHLKVYQKRPIYWLFDSGKENSFKALIYMHRYDADTVGRVRTDYLHRAQKYVETAMQSAQYTIDNATLASEKSKATKAVTKYTKQLAEMKIYDEAIAHVANQRIEIDLDDGVKVNYAKFQGIEVAQEGKKSIKVDLLAKI